MKALAWFATGLAVLPVLAVVAWRMARPPVGRKRDQWLTNREPEWEAGYSLIAGGR